MSIKILKPIKRFFRGLTGRMRVAVILLLVSALLLAGLGVYLLATSGDATGDETQSLFPGVDRAGIKSVLCHTVGGEEYTIKGSYYDVTDAYGEKKTYKRFYIVTADGDDEQYQDLTLDATQLSYFVVGTGKNYVYAPVISAPVSGEENYGEKLTAYENKRKELGFHDNSAYYQLTTETGEVYRVYYGIKDVTGNGYYVQLAGDNTIYATKSAFVGDLLQNAGPETLIDATINYPAQNQYAYAFPYRFAVRDYVRVTDKGLTVTDAYYAVGYTLIDADGNRLEGNLPLEEYTGKDVATKAYREAAIAFFTGKTIGNCNETFTFTYPDTEDVEEELRGKTVSHNIETIDYLTEETVRYEVKYLPMLEREISHKLSVYGFTAPSDMTSYIPDSDAFMSILENVMGLDGTVVKLGLDDATITKYGLYRYQIRFAYPFAAEFTVNDDRFTVGTDDTDDERTEKEQKEELAFFSDPANFMESWLYISEVTEKGTRYVGSIYYDLVVEVDAASLSFLDEETSNLVDDWVITAALVDVQSFQMFWNYGAGTWLSGKFDFVPTVEKVNGGWTGEYNSDGSKKYQMIDEVTKLIATPVGGGDAITLDPDTYYQLYSRFSYTRYKGEHGLTDEELDAILSDRSRCVLRLVMLLTDGTANEWEFYPISANRVVVKVKNGTYATEGARFVIYGTALADIANGYLHLMTGEEFNYEERYD